MKSIFKRNKYFINSLSIALGFTLLISTAYLFFTYQDIKREEIRRGEEYLSNFTGKVNAMIAGFDNISIQVAMLPSVNSLIYETDTNDLTNYYKLSKDLEVFSNYQTLNSIVLYFKSSKTLFSTNGGLDKLEEFSDRAFVKSLDTLGSIVEIYPKRRLDRLFSYPSSVEVFTLVRQIPIFNNGNGVVMVNVETAALDNLIRGITPETMEDLCILKDGAFLYSTDSNLESFLMGNGFDLPGSKTFTLDGKKVILQEDKLFQYGFKVYSLLPASVIDQKFNAYLGNFGRALPLIILIEIILAWFFGMLLTKPFNRLIQKIQANAPSYSGKSPEWNGPDGLSRALDGLFVYARDIVSTVEAHKPILRESLLIGMLWGNDNVTGLRSGEKIMEYGIQFDKHHYYALLCFMEEMDRVKNWQIKEQIRFYVLENVTRIMSEYGNIYGVLMENDKVAFILNTDFDVYENAHSRDCFLQSSVKIRDHMKDELGVSVLFSIGSMESEIQSIHKSYQAASNNLMYSSSFNDESIVFADQSSADASLDKLAHADLLNFIINRDEVAIAATVDTLVQRFLAQNPNYAQIKKTLITLISSIYIGLWERGIDLGTDNLTMTISKISNMTDFTKIQALLFDILKSIPHQIGSVIDEGGDKKIAAAIGFICENYIRDISVNDIAQHAGLNNIYLNRIFKLSTGKTLSEYLNIHRIQQSKELLKNASLSVQDISRMVGYNDVRSYIRYFKKFFGVTPTDFRNSDRSHE